MHRQKYVGDFMYATCLDKRRVGASTAKSLRFSPQSLTDQTSHNKYAFKQSF